MTLSVIIPTHNPDHGRLARTLSALGRQTLAANEWELVVVDNASGRFPPEEFFPAHASRAVRVAREPVLGLTSARRRGLLETRAPIVVFVDDDNVLAPDYLAHVARTFAGHPRLGAIGGRSLPEFEQDPAGWQREFLPLLALRDLGDKVVLAAGGNRGAASQTRYPAHAAPIGAGMALRREAVQPWLDNLDTASLSDRRGGQLSSAGDNDIVLTLLDHGWEVGYFPELSLTHLIPASRLAPDYLGRLNRGIQHSWMQVLSKHAANPWPPISRWSVPLRKLKAWFTHRAWSGAAARIRWQGACGHFDGRRKGSSR